MFFKSVCVNVSAALACSHHVRTGKKREKVKNKSDNCVFRVTQRSDLCARLFLVKRGHPTSLTLISAVHSQCASQFLPLFFILFFLYIHHIFRISSRSSCAACHSPPTFCVIPFIERTMETSCVLAKMHLSAHKAIFFTQKRAKASGSFFSFSFFSSSSSSLAWHSTRLGLCGRKPLLFIDWETRMTEWLTHLH